MPTRAGSAFCCGTCSLRLCAQCVGRTFRADLQRCPGVSVTFGDCATPGLPLPALTAGAFAAGVRYGAMPDTNVLRAGLATALPGVRTGRRHRIAGACNTFVAAFKLQALFVYVTACTLTPHADTRTLSFAIPGLNTALPRRVPLTCILRVPCDRLLCLRARYVASFGSLEFT